MLCSPETPNTAIDISSLANKKKQFEVLMGQFRSDITSEKHNLNKVVPDAVRYLTAFESTSKRKCCQCHSVTFRYLRDDFVFVVNLV